MLQLAVTMFYNVREERYKKLYVEEVRKTQNFRHFIKNMQINLVKSDTNKKKHK